MFLNNNAENKTVWLPPLVCSFFGREYRRGRCPGLGTGVPTGGPSTEWEAMRRLSWYLFWRTQQGLKSVEGRDWSWLRVGWQECLLSFPSKMDSLLPSLDCFQDLPVRLSGLWTRETMSLLGQKHQWQTAECASVSSVCMVCDSDLGFSGLPCYSEVSLVVVFICLFLSM